MKKIILLALLLNGLFLQAQILNPSFENVTTTKPDDYNIGFYSTYYIKDTTAPHTGAKAAYIKGFGAMSYSVQGAVLGTFTMNSRPETLTGWYKCNIVPGDSLVFMDYIYQSTTFTGVQKWGYAFTTTSTATYKQFTTTINYTGFPSGNVGSTFISIYLSGTGTDGEGITIPQTGTWAIIDDLQFNDPPPITTAMSGNNAAGIVEQVYPMPATDMAFLIYSLPETAKCDLKVFDVTGRDVKTIFSGETQSPGRYKAEVDVSNLSPGIYFTRLRVGNETHVSKIIKQ